MGAGLRHIIPISGKDSLATALVQTARAPQLKYEYLYTDAGMELPETYQWLKRVAKQLGAKVHRVGKPLAQVIHEMRMLPSMFQRFCTERSKIRPMKKFIGDDEAVLYIGLRADEGDRVGYIPPDGITAVFPLREEGISLSGVYDLLSSRGLMPPSFFWQRLYDDVMPRLLPASRQFVESLHEWQRHHLFAWRSRGNCFMCFFQRPYEWVGLLDHHPHLFDAAEKLEWDYGHPDSPHTKERVRLFTLRPDGPLSKLRARGDEVFRRRADKVLTTIVRMRTDPDEDYMATSSCGAFCGK